MTGEPRVRGFCHCEDCRDLLKIPYHSVTAWERGQVAVEKGGDVLLAYQHPTKRMKRFYCANCGETLFNSNAMDWRIVSQLLIRKCCGGELPEALRSTKHFFYGRRIVDVDDDLPKQD
jgi:hypothetical protein